MQEIAKNVLIQAAGGDIDAFEQIYKLASGFIYTVAYGIVHNKEDAEEVTQDVFMKIYRSLKSFEFRSSFKTWIYRITINTAVTTRKRKVKKKENEVGDFDVIVQTKAAPNRDEEKFERDYNRSLLDSLLTMLNQDQRVCLLLREVEGLSYQEIADVLKININTVRTRLKRARETLLEQKKKRGT